MLNEPGRHLEPWREVTGRFARMVSVFTAPALSDRRNVGEVETMTSLASHISAFVKGGIFLRNVGEL